MLVGTWGNTERVEIVMSVYVKTNVLNVKRTVGIWGSQRWVPMGCRALRLRALRYR